MIFRVQAVNILHCFLWLFFLSLGLSNWGSSFLFFSVTPFLKPPFPLPPLPLPVYALMDLNLPNEHSPHGGVENCSLDNRNLKTQSAQGG